MGLINGLNRRRWEYVRKLALDRDGWRCCLCGKSGMLEVDHIKPLKQGGAAYELENLQTLCRSCHVSKSRDESIISPARRKWRDFVSPLT